MENSNQHWARRFYTLWTGQALSLLGSQLVQFAIIWYLTEKTNSATTLAIASMMGLLPQVLLSPFIGTWVDRGNRRLIMIFADSIVAIATGMLALLFAMDMIQVWHIYLALLIRAIGGGFHQSAFGASTVLLVPKDQLARVQGFNQALNGGLNIISAPLGAYLLAILPMQGILAIDVTTALIAVSIVLLTKIPQPERGEQASLTFWQDFRAGFHYIIKWRGLVIILILAMVINFFFSATEPLTPLLITNHFNGGASQLGLWLALFSVGILLGGIFLGVWGGFKKKIVTALIGLIMMGILTFGIGIIPAHLFTVGLIVNTALGLTLPIVNGSIGATLQSTVAADMQGRVFAFIQSIVLLVSPIALIIAGPFADRFGMQFWFILAGCICALMGVVGFFFPDVIEIENKKQEEIIAKPIAELS
ncbi:MAG: major facilitator superfamily transporter [Chloroflexi bacterium OLB14]|nr:MAG: major facilitator superfamily transporter [Chloroflexi bacterium OLB14]